VFSALADAILGLSAAEYDLLKLLLLALAFWLLFRILSSFRKLRLLADTPSSRIASAAQGQVELEGVAEWMRGDRLLSPFSGERCVWYRCRTERRQRIHHRSQWIEDSIEVSEHPFRLVDDSGECIVDPTGASVLVRHSRSWYGSHPGQRRQPRLARFSPGINPRYRFSEQLIRIADSLHVVGELETRHHHLQPDDEDQRIDEIVAEWKKYPSRYLKDFDFNQDGKISGDEWALVRDRARQHLSDAMGPAIHVLRKPRDGRFPFLISAYDEETLLIRHRRSLLWSMLGFILLLYLLLFTISIRPW
jgi:hypothetical protein